MEQKKDFSRELTKLMTSNSHNMLCCDCKEKGNGWIDVKIGCFLCIRCAGLHREFGTDHFRIKSITQDLFTQNEFDNVKNNGNMKINEMYEAKMNDRQKGNKYMSNSDMKHLIAKKYIDKIFYDAPKRSPTPISILSSETKSSADVVPVGLFWGPEPDLGEYSSPGNEPTMDKPKMNNNDIFEIDLTISKPQNNIPTNSQNPNPNTFDSLKNEILSLYQRTPQMPQIQYIPVFIPGYGWTQQPINQLNRR